MGIFRFMGRGLLQGARALLFTRIEGTTLYSEIITEEQGPDGETHRTIQRTKLPPHEQPRPEYKLSPSKAIKLFLVIAAGWVSFYGTFVGFPTFVLEEGDQQLGIATMAIRGMGRYDLFDDIIAARRQLQEIATDLQHELGWMNPLAKPAWMAYFEVAVETNLRAMQMEYAVHGGAAVNPVYWGQMIEEGEQIITPPTAPQVYVGPPDETAPPIPGGECIVLNSTDALIQAIRHYESQLEVPVWMQQEITLVVPVTRVETRDSINIGHTPFGVFQIIAWTSNLRASMRVWECRNSWVVVTGIIQYYEAGGCYQIVVNEPARITQIVPLYEGGET